MDNMGPANSHLNAGKYEPEGGAKWKTGELMTTMETTPARKEEEEREEREPEQHSTCT